MLKTVGNWWRKTDTGPDEQTNNYEVLPFQIRIIIVDELSIHVLFCPDLQIFALALPHRTTIFLYTGFFIKVAICGKNQREQKPRAGRTRDFNAADNPEAKRACRLTGKFSCSVTTFFESCRCSVSPHKPTTAAAPCVPFYLRPTGGCLATLRTAGGRGRHRQVGGAETWWQVGRGCERAPGKLPLAEQLAGGCVDQSSPGGLYLRPRGRRPDTRARQTMVSESDL